MQKMATSVTQLSEISDWLPNTTLQVVHQQVLGSVTAQIIPLLTRTHTHTHTGLAHAYPVHSGAQPSA